MNADQLAGSLLTISSREHVCLLDSCGVRHLGSHLLIAGIEPVETIEISNSNAEDTLKLLTEKLSGAFASIFTLSYDFGLKLLDISSGDDHSKKFSEPDVFLSLFDVLIVHDYDTGNSFLVGNTAKFDSITEKLRSNFSDIELKSLHKSLFLSSNFTKPEYIAAIEKIKERIRSGDTYQTNLTQQITAKLPADLSAATIFSRLRRQHPAPFAAFISRAKSIVISASPERFFKVEDGASPLVSKGNRITTSPIKGTRKRGQTPAEDEILRNELLSSEKDRAENTMIVDLLRNDLGRICEYGSIEVEKLCEIEQHPSLFHLVSTVGGDLRHNTSISDILRAVFPCGSITGAPKISTMKIIADLEPSKRGLSMGAIGYSIPPTGFELQETIDLSVAIRTMVVRNQTAVFNVGGGIVIDSDAESEYEETLTKATALLDAMRFLAS